jgi:hypothetical protein
VSICDEDDVNDVIELFRRFSITPVVSSIPFAAVLLDEELIIGSLIVPRSSRLFDDDRDEFRLATDAACLSDLSLLFCEAFSRGILLELMFVNLGTDSLVLRASL